ncbi:tripartite tricarboxylate transporter TctB family protein [Bacillus fonticola]|uniref:tripartite tricarboxylate transporter TctB family protein n=1 Tax=Bacillus fonticola TaxID=2728853 RepID=UPI0014759B6D|nr:tripartite tricarboxylate transporter TctB family protein [Bacillus fonticola]
MTWTKNRVASLFLLILAIVYLLLSYQLPVYPYVPVDSDFVPKTLGYILIALSIALFFVKEKQTSDKEEEKIPLQDIRVLLAVGGMLLLYIFFLEILGFIVVTALFIYFCSWYLGYKKHKVNALVSLIFPCVMYYMFNYLLLIRLPQGILPF